MEKSNLDRKEQLKAILFGSPGEQSSKTKQTKMVTSSDVERVNRSTDIPLPQKKSALGSTGMKDRAMTAAISGIPAAVGGVKPKEALSSSSDLLPLLGQLIGGTAGGPGGSQMGKFGGSVAGAGVGLLGKELIGMSQGEEFKPQDIGIDTGITATFEAATRIPAAALFGKARSIDVIREGAGKQVNIALEKLSEMSETNPALRQSSSKILKVIEDTFSKVIDRSGKQGALINRFRKYFAQSPTVAANALIQFERRLGDVAEFGAAPGEVKNTAMMNATKALRNKISGIVDNLAERGSQFTNDPISKNALRNFRKNSKRVYEAFKVLETKNPGMIDRLVESVTLGSLTGNPMVGAATYAVKSQKGKQILYKGIEKTGIGRGATVAASEATRRAREGLFK